MKSKLLEMAQENILASTSEESVFVTLATAITEQKPAKSLYEKIKYRVYFSKLTPVEDGVAH